MYTGIPAACVKGTGISASAGKYIKRYFWSRCSLALLPLRPEPFREAIDLPQSCFQRVDRRLNRLRKHRGLNVLSVEVEFDAPV